ncbi:hypothetical protein Tco_1081966 [Tanacetum coccineum]|uniref:Uncharacterized protein n=1 Tax=Tanacetum coccineum TaxID=301880 RepID=A0ABQ5HYZ2_9ASTR
MTRAEQRASLSATKGLLLRYLKREGKVNPHYLAYRRAGPAMEDTESPNQKEAQAYNEDDFSSAPGHARMWIHSHLDPNFKSLRKTRMSNNVKTYDGTGDPEDHRINFQAGGTVEFDAGQCPMWCHNVPILLP